jgi:hypothetical protein
MPVGLSREREGILSREHKSVLLVIVPVPLLLCDGVLLLVICLSEMHWTSSCLLNTMGEALHMQAMQRAHSLAKGTIALMPRLRDFLSLPVEARGCIKGN